MTNSKRTVVTIERRERTIVHGNRGKLAAWCAQCGAEVQWVALEQAAALTLDAAAHDRLRLDESCELHQPEPDVAAPNVDRNLLPAPSHEP